MQSYVSFIREKDRYWSDEATSHHWKLKEAKSMLEVLGESVVSPAP